MAVKNTEIIERSKNLQTAHLEGAGNSLHERPKLIGKARPVSVEEKTPEHGETESLLHHSHDLVAQLREAVGRPRLDLS